MATSLNTEHWIPVIQDNLYEGVEYLNRSVNHDGYVNGRTVNVPISGAKPNAVVDRPTLPAGVSRRTDTLVNYNVESISTDPFLVSGQEVQFLSYDKVRSLLRDHIMALTELIAKRTLHSWGPEDVNNVILTTGDAANAFNLPPSGTGTRNRITVADVLRAVQVLDQANVPSMGRVGLCPPAFKAELLALDQFVSAEKLGISRIPEGMLGRAYGIDWYTSNLLPIYNGSTRARKAFNAVAVPASDSFAALIWHPSFVAKALGEIKVRANEEDPTYYGSVYSAEVFHGSTKLRPNSLGVVGIAQGIGA